MYMQLLSNDDTYDQETTRDKPQIESIEATQSKLRGKKVVDSQRMSVLQKNINQEQLELSSKLMKSLQGGVRRSRSRDQDK